MSRPQDRFKRFVKRITLTDSGRDSIDLPRDFDYESLIIEFSGTSTLSGAGTAVRAEAPLQAISWLNFKANGSDILDALSGVMAHRLGGMLRNGQLPPLTAASDATAAARTFSGCIILDRAVIDGIRAKDGNFPSAGLSTLQLEVIAGLATDLFTGTPAGTMTMTVDVSIVQTVEQVVSGKRSVPRVITFRSMRTESYAASNSAAEILLNSGNLLRGIMMRTYGGTTAGEVSNGTLNNAKIMVGNEVKFDLKAGTIRNMMAADINLSSIPTGYYLLDFMQMGGVAGKLSDCLDLRRNQQCKLVLDVTGATNAKIDIAAIEYKPYNPAQWGLVA